jgi:hypothetical protein
VTLVVRRKRGKDAEKRPFLRAACDHVCQEKEDRTCPYSGRRKVDVAATNDRRYAPINKSP